jgi:putative ABC transport system permease protein
MTVARFIRLCSHRLRSIFRQRAVDREVTRELSFHLDQLTQENITAGLPPDEARRRAYQTFGNPAVLQERCRDQRRVSWLRDATQDAMYGLRMLWKAPAFTIVASLSLALGIGANAAVLGVVNAALLTPLPFPDADRLVILRTINVQSGRRSNASLADYLAWRERARSFEAVEASLVDQRDFGPEENGMPAERISGVLFTPGLFSALGAQPLIGRVPTEADMAGSRPANVVVISHALWQRRFASDPNILQRSVRLGPVSFSIVGVMAPEFQYPDQGVEYWAPMALASRDPQASARFYVTVGRLRPGVTLAQAQAEMDDIARDLAAKFPDFYGGWGARVQPMHDALWGWTMAPLLTLQIATALVLAIACANTAALLLARGAVREPEIAMRVALGAGRGRIVRQLLIESVLLSLLGAVAGLVVANIGLRSLTLMTPPLGAMQMVPVSLDAGVLTSMTLIAVVTGLVFGVVPALVTSRIDLMAMANRTSHGGGHGRRLKGLRGGLVVAQISLALVLLITSGLLMKSFVRLAGRDLNFESDGLLRVDYRIPGPGYYKPIGVYQGYACFPIVPIIPSTIERIHERLRAVPGAESVGGMSHPPVENPVVPLMPILVEGQPRPMDEAQRSTSSVRYFLITPSLFSTLRTPLVRGRELTERDTASAPWVAIVNESMARRFWPGEDPVGKRFRLNVLPDEQVREVVGVVRDIPLRLDEVTAEPIVYASYLQQPTRYRVPWANIHGHMVFMVRSSGDPLALVPAVRRAVADVDPSRPVFNIASFGPALGRSVWQRHTYVFVLTVFAIVATLLAVVGLYGVTAFTVAQRTREIGIRVVLGAGAREVVNLVGRRMLAVITLGITIGLGASLLLARLIAQQLWTVTPTDPATFIGVSCLFALVTAGACIVPIRRALAVDPALTLHAE